VSANPPGPDLTFLWGIVNRAVRDPELRARAGGVVQNVWQSYQQTYLSQGLPAPALGIQTVNRLVSTAAAQARAETNLAASIATYRRTGLDQAITADHIAPDIDRRPGAGETSPFFARVRFSINTGVEGAGLTRNFTWSPELNLPQSVSGLLSALDEAGAAAAEDYGEEYGGLADYVGITAV
jgi:hypothetical protein